MYVTVVHGINELFGGSYEQHLRKRLMLVVIHCLAETHTIKKSETRKALRLTENMPCWFPFGK